MSKDLKLYKLIEKSVDYRWCGDSFCVWVTISNLQFFVDELKQIVGEEYFQDDGFDVKIQVDCVIFGDLNTIFDEFDFKEMFAWVESNISWERKVRNYVFNIRRIKGKS